MTYSLLLTEHYLVLIKNCRMDAYLWSNIISISENKIVLKIFASETVALDYIYNALTFDDVYNLGAEEGIIPGKLYYSQTPIHPILDF